MKREAVFVFGAGASVDYGVPVMNGFCDKVADLVESVRQHDAKLAGDFDLVLSWPQSAEVPAMNWFNPKNIEHLFCLWEMQREIGQPEAKDRLRGLLNVIVYTVERSYEWKKDWNPPDNLRTAEDKGYVKLLRKLHELYHDDWLNDEPPFSFLTLNYDLTLEDTWHSELCHTYDDIKQKCYDCIFESRFMYLGAEDRNEIKSIHERRRAAPLLPLARYNLLERNWEELRMFPIILKLHGSINWGICPTCDNVQIMGTPIDKRLRGPYVLDLLRETKCQWHPETHWKPKKLPEELHYEPLIIPPTFGKTGLNPTIRDIWRQAASEIAAARRLVFVGYSMPDTDVHIRYLLATALAGKDCPPVMIVNYHTDPAEEADTHKRYTEALGVNPDIKKGCVYVDCKFSDATDEIAAFLTK